MKPILLQENERMFHEMRRRSCRLVIPERGSDLTEEKKLKREEIWLYIVWFLTALILLYMLCLMCKNDPPWSETGLPMSTVFFMLRSIGGIEKPLWSELLSRLLLMFPMAMSPMTVLSVFMNRSRIMKNSGRIGMTLLCADLIVCICHCFGGKAVSGVAAKEAFLDYLLVCMTSAALSLRQETDRHEARHGKTGEEPEADLTESRRMIHTEIIVFSVVFSLLLKGAPLLYLRLTPSDGVLMYYPDNSIVSGRYEGWHRVPLGEEHTFFLPENWEITEDGSFLYIEDSNGRTEAIGKKIVQGPHQEEINEMISVCFREKVLDSRPFDGTRSQSLPNGECEWYEKTVTFEGGKEQNVLIMVLNILRNQSECQYWFCFKNPDEELYTRAGAMIYSFDK